MSQGNNVDSVSSSHVITNVIVLLFHGLTRRFTTRKPLFVSRCGSDTSGFRFRSGDLSYQCFIDSSGFEQRSSRWLIAAVRRCRIFALRLCAHTRLCGAGRGSRSLSSRRISAWKCCPRKPHCKWQRRNKADLRGQHTFISHLKWNDCHFFTGMFFKKQVREDKQLKLSFLNLRVCFRGWR